MSWVYSADPTGGAYDKHPFNNLLELPHSHSHHQLKHCCQADSEWTQNIKHFNLMTKLIKKLHDSLQQSIISPKLSLNNIIFLKDKTIIRQINNCWHCSMKTNHFLHVESINFNSSSRKYSTEHKFL